MKKKRANLRLDLSNHGSEITLRDFSRNDRPVYETTSPHDGLRIAPHGEQIEFRSEFLVSRTPLNERHPADREAA